MSNNMLKERGVIEIKEKCPFCNRNSLIIREYECEMPYVGRIFIISTVCEECGYVHKSVYPLEEKEACKIEYVIEDEEDLKVRVVKSSTARIIIPEIGATVDPGPASQTIITNVEGILDRIKEALLILIEWAEKSEEKKRGLEVLKVLNEALEGKRKLTLIIEDPRGVSCIIPPEERKYKLKITKLVLRE